jgi:hypothetical protein
LVEVVLDQGKQVGGAGGSEAGRLLGQGIAHRSNGSGDSAVEIMLAGFALDRSRGIGSYA